LIIGYLVTQPEGTVISKSKISKSTNLPLEYLSKLLQKLNKYGIVYSKKGTKGGYVLKQKPEDITLLQIINIFDGPPILVDCLRSDMKDCGRVNLCNPIIGTMKNVEREISSILENYNFKDHLKVNFKSI